jgi:hypothetical protein
VFSTWSGKPIAPNNILRRWVFPACEALGLERATWLTFRRTYSSWAHEKGVPGKVMAQLMGHAKVDTTLNVYTQVIDGALRAAVDRLGSELFTIVHKPEGTASQTSDTVRGVGEEMAVHWARAEPTERGDGREQRSGDFLAFSAWTRAEDGDA